MSPPALLSSLDLLLRGGAIILLLLIAALLVRDRRRTTAAQLGAAFAAGAAAFVLCSANGFHAHFGWFATIVLSIAAGNNFVFWLFARALFDDSFRPRPWHLALWCIIVVAALSCPLFATREHGAQGVLPALLSLQSVAFALLAAAQVLATWRNDLVEPRRRLRIFIVVAAAMHTLASAVAGITTGGPPSLMVGLWQTGFALAIAAIVAWSLLQASAESGLFAPEPAAAPAAPPTVSMPKTVPVAEDLALVAALERLMTVERIYRQEGLSIGQLAQRQGMPEYRLRRVINQGLGYRNFAAFLNHYRIGDTRAALADPQQAAVPILTIALDAGFNSLGPFNRSFKAETGLTPSEYRRQALGERADVAIGQPFSDSASRISNTA